VAGVAGGCTALGGLLGGATSWLKKKTKKQKQDNDDDDDDDNVEK
jgi:hypothetical protein